MEKKKYKRIKKTLDKYVYLPLIAVLVTVLFQQILLKGNMRETYKIELKKELLKEQYFFLEKMERIALLSKSLTHITFQTIYSDQNGIIYGEDKEGITIIIPTIAVEKKLQTELKALVSDIKKNKDKIDLDVYRAFDNVVKFIKEHPFPTNTDSLKEIEKTLWTESEIIGRWSALTEYMEMKVENKKNLKE